MLQTAPPRLSDRFVDDALRGWNRAGHGPGRITVIGSAGLGEGLISALCRADIGVEVFDDDLAALAQVARDQPQAVIITATAQLGDGAHLVRVTREFLRIPVLLALDGSDVSVHGGAIMAGALPVLSMPLRVPSLLHELAPLWSRSESGKPIEYGVIRLDRDRMTAHAGAGPLDLTLTEFELLACLAENGGAVVRRDELGRLWPLSKDTDGTLVAAIARLRRKLLQTGAGDLITTVRGLGYRLEPGTAA